MGLTMGRCARRGTMVDTDDPRGELNDSTLNEEIELLAELMEAVTQAGHQLYEAEIDCALHRDVADPSPEQAV